ncbi:MAG: TetR/AcrR family transcriptional regulator [Saprospiraceae bacterium]
MKHSAVKQNIIETASSLFYKKGYNLTGINEIIAEAGIAKATLYNHFKSKEDICIAYLHYMNSTFLKDINQFCKSKKKGKNQLLAVFDFLMQFFKNKDFNGCWCIKTVSELPKENETVKSVIRTQKNALIDFIRDLIEENNIRDTKKEADTLSKQIYLLYESAVSESHLHQDEWPIKSAKILAKQIVG